MVKGMSCSELAETLLQERGSLLVLDCRSFLSYNASHIRGSHNVYCSSIAKRRSHGSLPLHTLLPPALRRSSHRQLLLLDQRSPSADTLGPDSTARLLLHSLAAQTPASNAAAPSPHFLTGGYETFHSLFPEMCIDLIDPEPSAVPAPVGRGTPPHDQGGPVEILPFMYLGSATHSSRKDTLESLGITALLNVSANCPNCFEGRFMYKCIPVEDSHTTDISARFHEAICFIDAVKQSGGRVLVHCRAGISRSATICLAYLMCSQRLRLEEAFDFVKQRRSVISPNFSFMGQLLQFETEVLCR